MDDAAFWGLLYLIWCGGVGAVIILAAIFVTARAGTLNSVEVTPAEGKMHLWLFGFLLCGFAPLFVIHELDFPPTIGATWLVAYVCAVAAFLIGRRTARR